MKSAWPSFCSPSNTLTAAADKNHREANENRRLRLRIESGGKAKAREQGPGIEKRIDSGNTIARKLEHDERPRLVPARGVDPVLPKGWQPAGPRRDQPRSAAT